MGKIRVHTLGDESAEKEQQEKLAKKREAKRSKEKEELKNSDVFETKNDSKKKSSGYIKKASSKRILSKRHVSNVAMVEKSKFYTISEALTILENMKKVAFDETVELHLNTIDKGISGSVTLPHGTGKKVRVAIISPAKDSATADSLIKEIESGKISFDVLIATPDAMPKLAKVARVLGPRGLMPNPKAGTVTSKPEEVAKQYEGGQMNFKTESKLPVMHLSVGKISFGKSKLNENIIAAISAVQTKNIRKAVLKSTMSAGIRIQF